MPERGSEKSLGAATSPRVAGGEEWGDRRRQQRLDRFLLLRRRGITIRTTIDLLIGSWCIQNGEPLLHNDDDFRPMARHLGLIEVPTGA